MGRVGRSRVRLLAAGGLVALSVLVTLCTGGMLGVAMADEPPGECSVPAAPDAVKTCHGATTAHDGQPAAVLPALPAMVAPALLVGLVTLPAWARAVVRPTVPLPSRSPPRIG